VSRRKPTLTIQRGGQLRYLIEGSIGSPMFRHLPANMPSGTVADLVGGGTLSCAYYVSSMLVLAGLLEGKPHATVAGLEKAIRATCGTVDDGWLDITGRNVRIVGTVIFWGPAIQADGKPHRHVGFDWFNEKRVSHSDNPSLLCPVVHERMIGNPPRVIDAVYTHSALIGDDPPRLGV